MKIITISREFGSGGRELGKRLSDISETGYYDREILTAIAEKTELDEQYIETTINSGNIRSFPVTIGHTFSYMSGGNNTALLLAQQHKIIREIAAKGKDFVIVGRSADTILKEFKPFNIFVYADMAKKIKRCRERGDSTELLSDRELEKQIRRIDRSREESHALVSDGAWGNKSGYHLCINTSDVNIKEITPLIAEYAKQYFRRNAK